MATQTMQAKLNLTEREVESDYGLRLQQLRRWRMTNRGPKFLKVSGAIGRRGGRVLYRRNDVEAWLESRPTGGDGQEAQ